MGNIHRCQDFWTTEANRFVNKLKPGDIRALIQRPNSTEVEALDLVLASFALDPLDMDVALLQCERPDDADTVAKYLAPLPVDVEPLAPQEVCIIAGFSHLDKELTLEEEARACEMRGSMDIRAGRVIEVTTQAEWTRKRFPMIRASIPSLPGMSGGPAMRLSYPIGPAPMLHGVAVPELLTVAGIVSRGVPKATQIALAYANCPDGETWITPMLPALNYVEAKVEGRMVKLADLLADGRIASAASAAEHIRKTPPVPLSEVGVRHSRWPAATDKVGRPKE